MNLGWEAPTRIRMGFPRILIRVRGRGFRKLREDDGPHRASGDGGNAGGNRHAANRPPAGRRHCKGGGGGRDVHGAEKTPAANRLSSAALQKSTASIIGELADIGCKCHQARSSAIRRESIGEKRACRLRPGRRENPAQKWRRLQHATHEPPAFRQLRKRQLTPLRGYLPPDDAPPHPAPRRRPGRRRPAAPAASASVAATKSRTTGRTRFRTRSSAHPA